MQNFNSLGCLVLEISAFQYDAYHGFRVGASVHKLFVGGVHMPLATLSKTYGICSSERILLRMMEPSLWVAYAIGCSTITIVIFDNTAILSENNIL